MIATFAAVVLAFIGAAVSTVAGGERANGEPWRATAWGGLALIALALALAAS